MNLSEAILKLSMLAKSTAEHLPASQQDEFEDTIAELIEIDGARTRCALCADISVQTCSCGRKFCKTHVTDSVFRCENTRWHSLDDGEAYCTQTCCSMCGMHCDTHVHHWCARCVRERRRLFDCAECGAVFCCDDVVECHACGRIVCFECDKNSEGASSAESSTSSDPLYRCSTCAAARPY